MTCLNLACILILIFFPHTILGAEEAEDVAEEEDFVVEQNEDVDEEEQMEEAAEDQEAEV